MLLSRALLVLVAFALVAFAAPCVAEAGKGKAPVALDCKKLACAEVLPGATQFLSPKTSVAGRPAPYRVGKNVAGELVGWVVLSTDVVDIKAYSGQPMVTLVGITPEATIAGAKVVHHSEPILLLGIPERKLHDFVKFYTGKSLTAKIAVGSSPDKDAITVDVISGATVTVLAQNRTILDAGRAVGEAVGVIKASAAVPGHFVNDDEQVWTWRQMVDKKVFGRLTVSAKQMGLPPSDVPFIDLHFTIADPPQIGRALLGGGEYRYQREQLKKGEHLLVVLGNGSSSFKGSGFVRGGIFDRVRVEQGLRALFFTDQDYKNLTTVPAEGAPSFKEGAIFIAREGKLDPGRPFHLVFLGSRYNQKGGFSRDFHAFRATLRLPRTIYQLEGADPQGGIVDAAWYNARWRLVALGAFLAVLSLLFFARRFLTGDQQRLRYLHLTMLLIAVVGLGFSLRAQPSVTQVLTLAGSAVRGWRWQLFLSEPLIFVFWIWIALTTVTWGRGVFCGWACPYGALSELMFKLGRALRLPELELPERAHRVLRLSRYLVLLGLIAVFLYSPQLGELLAEVEPFKTTFFVLPWSRGAFFIVWWVALLLLALFTFRPFCRYVCPLGAALAIPGSLRFSGPRRREFCSTCKICTRTCEPRAIRDDGSIDPRECLSCMECEANFRDEAVCPPLVGLAKLRAKRAAGTFKPADEAREAKLEERARPL